MLVKPKHKKLVLRLRKPEQVLAVIPTAKTLEYKGKQLVVVPHLEDETKILRNLGIMAPMPISYYYPYPGQYTPFGHQRETAEFLTAHNRAFCLDEMGTGKSLSTLWAYDHLRNEGKAKRAVIITPLSTLDATWGNTIFRNFPHLTFSVLHGSRSKRFALLEQEVDVYLLNHDGAKILGEALAAREDIDTVIIDEIAQVGRNSSTDKWKALKKLVKDKPRVWGLTGTPTPNAPTDAWAQCKLISPENVPPYQSAFRDATMKKIGQFKWVPKQNANEIVSRAMQPSIRHRRDECIDLPPCTYETRKVELTAEQQKMYKTMLAKLNAEYNGQQVTAANEAVKLMKLIQIACGVVYANDGEDLIVPSANRLSETQEIIEAAGSKVIVFVPFTSALEAVTEYLRKSFTVEIIQGATPKYERDRIFRQFQHEDEPRVIVAQPASMSHGLTLTAASTIVWFAPINSLETYEQANARITRPGQKQNQLIVNIEGSAVERAVYDRLRNKGRMQGILLDMLEKGV